MSLLDLLKFLMTGDRTLGLTTNDIDNMHITIDKMEYKREPSKHSYGNGDRDTYYLTIRCEKLEQSEIHKQWNDPRSKNSLIELKDKIVESYTMY